MVAYQRSIHLRPGVPFARRVWEKMPEIEYIEEPYIRARVLTPQEYVGGIMKLAQERRGVQNHMEYPAPNRVMLDYEIPLNEIVLDFYDQLKSISKGYASLDYELIDFRKGALVKLDILLNGEIVDALSDILYVVYGAGVSFGVNLDTAFDIVL